MYQVSHLDASLLFVRPRQATAQKIPNDKLYSRDYIVKDVKVENSDSGNIEFGGTGNHSFETLGEEKPPYQDDERADVLDGRDGEQVKQSEEDESIDNMLLRCVGGSLLAKRPELFGLLQDNAVTIEEQMDSGNEAL